MRRTITAAGIFALLGCVTVATSLSGEPSAPSSGGPEEGRAASVEDDAPKSGRVRGCRDRIDAYVGPRDAGDTRIGPVMFDELRTSYRYSVRHRDVPIKTVAVVQSGERVTITVPRSQRGWLDLRFAERPRAKGDAITLQACRHHSSTTAQREECGWGDDPACVDGPTHFNGGIAVDFVDAPRNGRCATVIVAVAGRKKRWREPLFAADRKECRS